MDWKKLIPHVAAVVLMAIISVLYCSPVLQGKRLVQDDIVKNIAQGKETRDYREANGEEALWTTRVFSGMTTFHIGTRFATNITMYLDAIFREWMPRTANVIFAALLGFYILLIAFRVNPWLAMAMAITYGISSNLIVSIAAGHVTKVMSIAYLAPAVGGVVLGLNGKRVLGGLLALLFTSLMIQSNHFQILYYYLLICLVVGVVYLIYAIREKSLNDLAKNVGVLAIAAVLALLPNAGKMYNSYAHSDETIRGGKSELSAKEEKSKGGLSWDYAMRWSYGPLETLTLVVPSFKGGATAEALPEDGKVAEELKKYQLNRQQKENILAQGPMYIGEQPFLLGTVYFGAGFIFLFVLSLFLVKGRTRVWVLSVLILSLIISWGRHAEFITRLLFDYFPFYNKFRTPSMALAIAGFAIPLLGVLGLQKVFSGEVDKPTFTKAFKYTIYITGGLMLLLLIYGFSSDWIGSGDDRLMGKNSPWAIEALYEALLEDRAGRFRADWFVSFLVMAVSAIVVWLRYQSKLSVGLAIGILAVVFGGDMWRVSKRYLNNDDFVSEREFMAQFNPTPADQSILQDPDPHYRVLNVTRNPWTDGMTCYHHENVGGHHAAKLQRYQDLIERQLSSQLQNINGGIQQNGQQLTMSPTVAASMPVYNMLNTKYFIVQDNNPGGAVRNPNACGNAWFVNEVKEVADADAEMAALADFNPLSTAIVSSEEATKLAGYDFGKAGDARLQLTAFKPNYLKYTSSNSQDGLAVFSEVNYGQGWEALVDGAPAEIIRVNYILRAIKVPAGTHEVEMRFAPASFQTGMNISLAGSVLFLLFAGGLLFVQFKKTKEQD